MWRQRSTRVRGIVEEYTQRTWVSRGSGSLESVQEPFTGNSSLIFQKTLRGVSGSPGRRSCRPRGTREPGEFGIRGCPLSPCPGPEGRAASQPGGRSWGALFANLLAMALQLRGQVGICPGETEAQSITFSWSVAGGGWAGLSDGPTGQWQRPWLPVLPR